MLLLIVGPKLDLALETSKLTGLVKGDRVGAIQDIISCLASRGKGGECCVPSLSPLPPSTAPGKSSPYLHIEKVQLYRVPGVHILV